ncbi:MAG TPA: response regulator [Thermoanaerobaculia bacterium]|nr:response regulator [Thermoanaerobaculia bacterium]
MRVLVLDDHADTVDVLSTLLEMWGHQVRPLKDSQTAVAAALEFQPHAALIDIGMPAVSGYDVARALRRQTALNGVRLIAVTGFGRAEDRRRTREAGFDHHLLKPIDPSELRLLLEAPPLPQP